MSAEPKVMLTSAEAAFRCGFSETHMRRLRQNGGGPSFVKIGRSVRYPIGSIDGWLADHLRNSTKEAAQ